MSPLRSCRGAIAVAALACLAVLPAEASVAAPPEPTPRAITPQEARAWKPDLATARRFADTRTGDVSLALVDMRGRLHESGGYRGYITASTFKVMLLVAYLRQDSVARRGLTGDERALLGPMIRRSDNDSATRVRDLLGRGPIEALAARAGMRGFELNPIWGYCRTTARDQAVFLRGLPSLLPDRHRAFALRQLESIIPRHRWGIADVKPRGWSLHFKGGWGLRGLRVEHQVAVLRHGPRRIGVAVLSEGNPSRRYGRATLEGVFRRLLPRLPR